MNTVAFMQKNTKILLSIIHSIFFALLLRFYLNIDIFTIFIICIMDVFIMKYCLTIFYKYLNNEIEKLTINQKAINVFFAVLLNVIIWNKKVYFFDTTYNSIKSIFLFIFISIILYLIIFPINIKFFSNVSSMNYIKLNKISPKDIFIFALPCIIIWSLFLLIFYPGLMSSDSIDQWIQKSTFIFSDWHPATHTFYIMLITLMWNSPAVVALVQIFFLSFVFGYSMYLLEVFGISKKSLFIVSLIYSIYPGNILMSISLWKDVPYSILIYAVTILLFKLYISKGNLLNNKWAYAIGLLAGFIPLFRHNGILVTLLIYLFLIVFYFKNKKNIIINILISFFIILIIQGPIFKILNVQEISPGIGFSFYMHQLASVVVNNGNLNDIELKNIQTIVDESYIKDNFNKYTHDTLGWGGEPYFENLSKNYKIIIPTYISVFYKNPKIMIVDWFNLTDLVWDLFEPPDSTTNRYIDKLPWQVAESMNIKNYPEIMVRCNNKFDDFRYDILRSFKVISKNSILYVLFWRHGIYLFILFYSIIINYYRIKKLDYIILYIPVLANVFSLFISMVSQDYRYVYPTYVVLPFLLIFSYLINAGYICQS